MITISAPLWISVVARHIDWGDKQYHGVDVVESVIEKNIVCRKSETQFTHLISLDQVPTADLLICKDVLKHLSNAEISELLDFFKRFNCQRRPSHECE